MNKLVENKDARYLSVKGACEEINVCRNTLMRTATEANAVVRLGNVVRIDMPVLHSYIDQVCRG